VSGSFSRDGSHCQHARIILDHAKNMHIFCEECGISNSKIQSDRLHFPFIDHVFGDLIIPQTQCSLVINSLLKGEE